MGAEFIEKATPGFRKSWDKARTALATADLFTRTPEKLCRTATADILGNARLAPGDWLTVEILDEVLIARRGNSEVASFNNPPPELLQAVKDSCGIAKGVVEDVHTLAGVVEISLC